MLKVQDSGLLPTDEADTDRDALQHPPLTVRWLRDALAAGRSAFEREMRRDRKTLDQEFERFWKEQSARQA